MNRDERGRTTFVNRCGILDILSEGRATVRGTDSRYDLDEGVPD